MLDDIEQAYESGRKRKAEELKDAIDALKELYHKTALLRVRIADSAPQLRAFSEYEATAQAMRLAENAIRKL